MLIVNQTAVSKRTHGARCAVNNNSIFVVCFKFICEQVHFLDEAGQTNRFLFGFEESYGYLSGTEVRDKDAVNAALLLCEMAGNLKAEGKTLLDRLQEELYRLTGCAPSTLAYPYGFYDDALEGITEEMGFQATLTCDFGVNRLTHDPDCLRGMKRICRSHGAELEGLLAHAYATLN